MDASTGWSTDTVHRFGGPRCNAPRRLAPKPLQCTRQRLQIQLRAQRGAYNGETSCPVVRSSRALNARSYRRRRIARATAAVTPGDLKRSVTATRVELF